METHTLRNPLLSAVVSLSQFTTLHFLLFIPQPSATLQETPH